MDEASFFHLDYVHMNEYYFVLELEFQHQLFSYFSFLSM